MLHGVVAVGVVRFVAAFPLVDELAVVLLLLLG